MEKMIITGDDDGDHVPTTIGLSPSTSEGKMVIKLKIPSSKPEGKRVCLECKKEFSSGKALGGHMRIHVNHVQSAYKKIKNPNFLQELNNGDNIGKPYYKPYYMNSVNEDGKPTCSLCGKTFPSMKSLFGHMRCHPERVWRGILPPPNTNTPVVASRRRRMVSLSETSSSHVDDDGGEGGGRAVDLTRFLRGWTVTSRRGRKDLKAADEDAVLLTAAEDLMTLANGNGNGNGNGNSGGDMIRSFSENEFDSGMINMNEEFLGGYKYKIKRRKKMKLMMELGQNNACVTVVSSDAGVTPVVVVQEQQLLERVGECKYKCTSCDKCFANHRALGGHRSGHNKSKVKSTDYDRIEDDDFERCVMNQSGNNSSQITSTGEAGSQMGKVFEFDLNEVPGSMMEEDEEVANGNGYASSSYNSNMS